MINAGINCFSVSCNMAKKEYFNFIRWGNTFNDCIIGALYWFSQYVL